MIELGSLLVFITLYCAIIVLFYFFVIIYDGAPEWVVLLRSIFWPVVMCMMIFCIVSELEGEKWQMNY
jgi:hypothetical protein